MCRARRCSCPESSLGAHEPSPTPPCPCFLCATPHIPPSTPLQPPQRDERAIQELKANGCSRAEAIHLLEEHGGDAEAALAWLLEREQAGDAQLDQAAVAELMANGLSRADAEAALWQCDGNVDQVRGWCGRVLDMGYAAGA